MASINDFTNFFNKEKKNNIFIFTHASRIKCIMNELFDYSFKHSNIQLDNLDIISITKHVNENKISILKHNFLKEDKFLYLYPIEKSKDDILNTLLESYNIFLVRHGFAYHNKVKHEFETKLLGKPRSLYQKIKENKVNTELIDQGISQAYISGKNFKTKFNKTKTEFNNTKTIENYIFISDLKRTFQTFELFFAGYNSIDDKNKIFIKEQSLNNEINNKIDDIINILSCKYENYKYKEFKYIKDENFININSIHMLPCSHELDFKHKKQEINYCDKNQNFEMPENKSNIEWFKKIENYNNEKKIKINTEYYNNFYNTYRFQTDKTNTCKKTHLFHHINKIMS